MSANTVVRFHRLLIVEGASGIYYVMRWGGKSQLATRKQGLAAIWALKAGQSVGEVQRALAPPGKTISIHRLLEALLSAGLIRSIDGVPVSGGKWHLFATARCLFRIHVVPHCLALICKCPIPAQRWARCALASVRDFRSLRRRAHTADENILSSNLAVPKCFRSGYLYHLVWNIADTETIFASRPAQAKEWLDEHVDWTGQENLDFARSFGRGLICAGFHFSATRLVAPLLVSRGLPLNLTATSSPTVCPVEACRWHEEFCSVSCPDARFKHIYSVDFSSVKGLLAALARNEAVLTFPDMHTINPNSDEVTRQRCAFFGITARGFKPPTVTADVAGVNARMNEFVGWLAAQSGSPVVPVILLRTSGGKFLMIIERPIIVPTNADRPERADMVNGELFRVLDRYIRAYPSQWFGWHRFHLQRTVAPAVLAVSVEGSGVSG